MGLYPVIKVTLWWRTVTSDRKWKRKVRMSNMYDLHEWWCHKEICYCVCCFKKQSTLYEEKKIGLDSNSIGNQIQVFLPGYILIADGEKFASIIMSFCNQVYRHFLYWAGKRQNYLRGGSLFKINSIIKIYSKVSLDIFVLMMICCCF